MILDLLNFKNDSLSENIYRFRTNATTFNINFQLAEPVSGGFPNFGRSAREGLLLVYKFLDESYWFNIDAFARNNNPRVNMAHITDGKRVYDVMVYGPNLTSLSKLIIEIPDGSMGEIIDMTSNRKMMILGGLNTFGIGCTSSGIMFSNVLQRNFNAEVKKIVFNDKNYLDKIWTRLKNEDIPKVDVSIIEITCSNQSDGYVEKYLDEIISILERYSDYIICWLAIPNSKLSKKEKALKIINSHNVIFKDMSFIFEDDFLEMCTYGYNFINDSANMFIAKKLTESLNEVVRWNI